MEPIERRLPSDSFKEPLKKTNSQEPSTSQVITKTDAVASQGISGTSSSSSQPKVNVSAVKIENLGGPEVEKVRRSFNLSSFVMSILSVIRNALSYLNIFAYFNKVKPEIKPEIDTQVLQKNLSDAARNLIAYFEAHPEALEQEGIFRLSGRVERSDPLLNELKKNPAYSLNGFSNDDLANVLKKIFGEMNLFEKGEALQKFELVTEEITDGKKSEDEKINSFKELINLLTPDQKQNLKEIIGLFVKVSKNEQKNKMSPYNLAVVFGPRLAPNNSEVFNPFIGPSISLVQDLIKYHEKIFD